MRRDTRPIAGAMLRVECGTEPRDGSNATTRKPRNRSLIHRVLRRAGVKSSAVARSQQLKPRVLELWQAGWKADAIAHACGTTVKNVWATAYRAAKKNPALRRHAPPITPAEIERVVALRREGHYSGAQIAQLMDLNHGAVTRTIRKLAQSDPDLALDTRLVSKSRMSEVLLLMAQVFTTGA